MVKARQPPGPNAVTGRRPLQENGEIMAQYSVDIHHPDNYDPSVETEAMSGDIDALNYKSGFAS
jgi:hypothetical protein